MGLENEEVEVDVAIVGGGFGGVALAVALQERGIHAHVFERTPKIRPHFGTGMVLGLNGMRALDGIKQGLRQKVADAGCLQTQYNAYVRSPGAKERIQSLKGGEGSVLIQWKCAYQILVDELLDLSVFHWRHTFVDYKIVQGGVEAHFKVEADDDGDSFAVKVVRAKLLVGADGVRSQVRKTMVGDEPRDLWLITWNAIVPTDAIRALDLHENGEIRVILYTASNSSTICFDVGSDCSIVQVRAADKSGEITKSFPLDLKTHSQNAKKVRMLKHLENVQELQNVRIAVEGIDPDRIREGRHFDRLPLSSWSDLTGHVLLIGDAAHAMYPGAGQGGRIALEDAHQLSILLHEALSSPDPESAVPAAVKRFEEVRIQRVKKIQSLAAEMTGWPEFIPEWVQKLPPQEKWKRMTEFNKWTQMYPEAMAGDPHSTYWKP